MVIKSGGAAPEIISTLSVASQIQDLSNELLSEAYGWSYQYKQQTYYVLTVPRGNLTLVYNLNTKKWHNWKTESTGSHRGACHAYVYGKHLIGDSQSGRILELDWDTYKDLDEKIVRLRRTGPIAEDGVLLRHNGIELAAKTGIGNADALEPKVHLRWSDNNGKWSSWHSRNLGSMGPSTKRLFWRGLGSSTERVYELRITDPVDVVLVDCYANIKKGREFGA